MSASVQTSALAVGFVLLQRFTLLPFAAFIDCLRLAADEGDHSRQLHCNWTLMTSVGHKVFASCGVAITSCVEFRDPANFDYIVVIGGIQEANNNVDQNTLDYLRHAASLGIPVVGICTGTFALIQSGLLTGRRCCVSWYHHGDLVRRFPDITPVADRLFIDEGDIITCAGGIASAYLSAYLVERHLGRAWAMKSLHIMLIDEARKGDHPQPQPVVYDKITDRIVRRAVNIITQHMGEVISITELARRLGTSRRNIERKFRDELNVTPQRFARNLRLRYGLWLLHYTTKNITEIGERCGFSDTAHFSRQFREEFGYPPSRVRKMGDTQDLISTDPFFLYIEGMTSISSLR